MDLTSPLVLKLCESIEANCAPIRNITVGDRADSSEEYSKIVEIESLLVENGDHLERQLESSTPRWDRDARVQCCIHSHAVPVHEAEVEGKIEQRVQIEKAAAQPEESDAEISQIPENQPSEIPRSALEQIKKLPNTVALQQVHLNDVMPNYAEMEVHDLKALLLAYGVRPGPKRYMVDKLSEIWLRLQLAQSSTRDEASSQANAEDSERLELRKRQRKHQQEERDKRVLSAAVESIRLNATLYERMLLLESLPLEEVVEELAEDGVRISMRLLAHLLNEIGAPYTHRSSRRNKTPPLSAGNNEK